MDLGSIDHSVVSDCLTVVTDAFEKFLRRFNEVSRKATVRFEARDWSGFERDSVERLGVYSVAVDRTVVTLHEMLGVRAVDRELWRRIKAAYSEKVEPTRNREIAETFFNSISRRVFETEGVRPDIEFIHPAESLDREVAPELIASYPGISEMRTSLRRILEDADFRADYRDLDRDHELVAKEVGLVLRRYGSPPVDAIEMLRPVFFRVKHAYRIGRIRSGQRYIPFVLALLHDKGGVYVDAVLMDENEVSILFSFTRAYFHVETHYPREIVHFVESILPRKPIAELYIAIGFDKHGKTELYRSLQRQMETYQDDFEPATGDRGMVMLVFTLPAYDLVFKVIRDRFAPPKHTTAQDVRRRYQIVFERDRVGRLVEAQEFEHLKFDRSRFTPELLDELVQEASGTVRVDRRHVVIDHLYTERKVQPLNLYLRQVSPELAHEAVIDYGAAIKELAAANIFPGDFLLKNFGVTRHGRVVFYDYDELCLLSDCNFRRIPPPRTPEDELAAEPWFSVAPNDVFPEEFRHFLGLSEDLAQTFQRHHSDLFDAEYWRGFQKRHEAGEILDFYPYAAHKRLHSSQRDGASLT